ncbi:hypothetical protein D047_0587 [Vibrio parahaemolyticus VPTS-2010_2]|nr:hypothetical protein D047_0587 [Vibrio parahaemolyticus VPTS-2010_2]
MPSSAFDDSTKVTPFGNDETGEFDAQPVITNSEHAPTQNILMYFP